MTNNEWLELVINYDACGEAAIADLNLGDRQKECIACAARDLRHTEDAEGSKDADDFCEAAKDATYGWMDEFHKYVTINGAEADFEAAANMMDADIREDIHHRIAPCTNQEFADAYCAAHLAKYGEAFKVN